MGRLEYFMSESSTRRVASNAGYRLVKSRANPPHRNNWGGYQLVDERDDEILAGEKFELTLEAAQKILHGMSVLEAATSQKAEEEALTVPADWS